MTYTVTLLSAEDAKWPRYEIRMAAGLTLKDARRHAVESLRVQERQVIILSQFSYDPATGVVNTRVSQSAGTSPSSAHVASHYPSQR